ncbi:MAG: hypothetical protein KA144_00190 [Xanthomonadaceae bacterium]|nr:hypothetical protein [Xanthomonadaceae bacterium]
MAFFAKDLSARFRGAAAVALCVVALAATTWAVAGNRVRSNEAASAAAAPTIASIVAQQIELRAKVAARRGPFREMSEGDRHRLMAQQDRILELLKGRDSLDGLRAEERVEVFNHLESVKAAVAQAEDERLICERTRLTGSHRYSVVCITGREYREHKENARKSLRTVMKCEGGCNSD